MSPLGTFVRAYVEDAGWAFFSWDVRELSRDVVEASAFDVEGTLAALEPSGRRPEYQGAVDYHVAEVSGPPERTQVTVCWSSPRLGSKGLGVEEGFSTNVEGELPSIRPFLLVISREGQAPPAGMIGSEKVPPKEAFGDWRALRYEPVLSGDEKVEAQHKCNSLLGLPAGYPDSPASVTTVPSVPEVAPSPGWPVGSASVAGSE